MKKYNTNGVIVDCIIANELPIQNEKKMKFQFKTHTAKQRSNVRIYPNLSDVIVTNTNPKEFS